MAAVAIPACLLAACGGEAPADDGRSATGDVLEGTISDAMLPTDRVRSEAPLAAPEPTPDRDRGEPAPDAETTSAAEGEAAVVEGEAAVAEEPITPLDLGPAEEE